MDPMVLGARNVRSPFHLLVAVVFQGQCGSRNQGGQRSLWWPFGETRERLEGQPTSQANTFTKPRNVESQVFNASCCHPSFCSHRSLKKSAMKTRELVTSSVQIRCDPPRNPRNEPHVDRRPRSSIAQRRRSHDFPLPDGGPRKSAVASPTTQENPSVKALGSDLFGRYEYML